MGLTCTGDLYGAVNRPNLGDPREAAMFYEQALRISDRLVAQDAENRQARYGLATRYGKLRGRGLGVGSQTRSGSIRTRHGNGAAAGFKRTIGQRPYFLPQRDLPTPDKTRPRGRGPQISRRSGAAWRRMDVQIRRTPIA